jgi:hypothetical protein
VTKSKIRAYFFALLLLAAGVVYVGRSGFHLPGGSDDSHTLVLSASWKLAGPAPYAYADINIEWAVGAKHDSDSLRVDNTNPKVWNHTEHNYHGEYSWIRIVSRNAKVVSCGINFSGAWVVMPQDKPFSAYCYFPLHSGPRK